MAMWRRLGAEFFGTFWLTFAGCGSAVLAAGFPSLGIGFLGVSLAFGLTVLTMAYAVGHVSGGHFNSAVTIRSSGPEGPASRPPTFFPTSSHRSPALSAAACGTLCDRLGQAQILGSRWVKKRTVTAILAPENTVWCRVS